MKLSKRHLNKLVAEEVDKYYQEELTETYAAALGYHLMIKPSVSILTDPNSSDTQKTAAALDIVEIIPVIGTPVGVANGLIKLSMNPPQYLSALGSFAAAILSAVGLGFVAKAGRTAGVITVLKNSTARKSLTKLINSLKGPLKESGPKGAKLAERLDNVLPAGKSASIKFEKDINKIKDDLVDNRDDLTKALDDAFDKPVYGQDMPPLEYKELKKVGYEDALKVGAKASKFIPDIAFPVFAKKLLVRFIDNLSKVSPSDTRVLFKDQIEYIEPGGKNPNVFGGGFSSANGLKNLSTLLKMFQG